MSLSNTVRADDAQHTSTTGSIRAINDKNQQLVSALYDLSRVLDDSATSYSDRNVNFKSRALETAALSLSQVEFEIVDGKSLTQGRMKVKGVGKATAYYIDEFLKTGKLAELEKYTKAKSPTMYPQVIVAAAVDEVASSTNPEDTVQINRAPVLSLWVTVVAEKLGYNHTEALSYAQWITGLLARSKGKKLGMFEQSNDEETYEPSSKRFKRGTNDEEDYVCIFQNIKVPVNIDSEGNRIAIEGDKSAKIDTKSTERYLQRSFGEKFIAVKDAMLHLVNMFRMDEMELLTKEAYRLYEHFRPDWVGWGNKSTLNLAKIRDARIVLTK